MTAAAFRAAYADFKLVKTRGQIQIIFEAPVEQANDVLAALGGMPTPGQERWFGIARLAQTKEVQQQQATTRPTEPRSPPAGARKSPSQMAGILCEDARFRTYLRENDMLGKDNTAEAAAVAVRLICGVRSRSEFDKDKDAAARWEALYGRYRAWVTVAA